MKLDVIIIIIFKNLFSSYPTINCTRWCTYIQASDQKLKSRIQTCNCTAGTENERYIEDMKGISCVQNQFKSWDACLCFHSFFIFCINFFFLDDAEYITVGHIFKWCASIRYNIHSLNHTSWHYAISCVHNMSTLIYRTNSLWDNWVQLTARQNPVIN